MNDLFIYTPYVWEGVSRKKRSKLHSFRGLNNKNYGATFKIMRPASEGFTIKILT